MSTWREHKARILKEIGLWASHPRNPDSSPRTSILAVLNDAELMIHEAARAEEEKEYMNGVVQKE